MYVCPSLIPDLLSIVCTQYYVVINTAFFCMSLLTCLIMHHDDNNNLYTCVIVCTSNLPLASNASHTPRPTKNERGRLSKVYLLYICTNHSLSFVSKS